MDELDNQMIEDLFGEVKLLLLNDIEMHLLNRKNGALIILVHYGPKYYNKNRALEFKSLLDMYDNLTDFDIRQTTDGRISISCGDDGIALDEDQMMTIFSEVLQYRFNDGGLISNDKPGGLIAKFDEQQFRCEKEDIVLYAPDNRILPYLRSFVNNALFAYDSMVIVGGERPHGFTEFNPAKGFDLVTLIEDRTISAWIPFIRLMEQLTGIDKFANHFQELWSIFMDSVTEEQKSLVDFQFLINRINDQEVNLIASLDDYKKQAIQIGFSLFDNSLLKGMDNVLPNKLWMPIVNNRQTTLLLSYLLINKEYDLVVVNDVHLSRYINREEIKNQLKLISQSCWIYTSHVTGIWKDCIEIYLEPNPSKLQYLSKMDPDISVLSGNHMVIDGRLISGIQYNHESDNWNIREIDLDNYLDIGSVVQEETKIKEDEKGIIEESSDEDEREEPSQTKADTEQIYEQFSEVMGIEDYVYRANQSSTTFDHKTRLELLDHMSRSFEVLIKIYNEMGRQVNMSKIDQNLHDTVDELVGSGLLSKVQISEDDHVLGLQDSGEKFITSSITRMIQVDDERLLLFLSNMSAIREMAEQLGSQSYLRALIAISQLVQLYYYRRQNKLDHLLTAITITWDDSVLDNPDNFNKLFFARYYSRLKELYRLANTEEEEKQVDLNRIPTSKDEVHDITTDPLEAMDVITVKKVNKTSPYVPKKEQKKQVVPDETTWVKDYDTPTSDTVSIKQISKKECPSVLVDGYVILGDTTDITLDRALALDIDNLRINTRAKNLLREKGVSLLNQLRDFDKSFVSISGIGEKMNDKLSGLRKSLRKMDDPDELVRHLSTSGQKEYVLMGGTIDNMDHSYLRRINGEELSGINELIESKGTPEELVKSVTEWILNKLGRNVDDKLEDMLGDLGLFQERSNPLLMREGKLTKLGFSYVYKKQVEFEDSIEYSKIIAELREYVKDQMENLVFPVQAIQSAETLMDRVEKLELNTDDMTSFITAKGAYQSNDYKSSFSLFYTTFEGYLRRECERLSITPEFDDREANIADLNRELNSKMELRLPVKPFEGELRVIRNAIVHGNNIDERRISNGLSELLEYVILVIERIESNSKI